MYINFWYPIGLSKEVSAEQPFRVQVFGLPFVAFRDDDGEAHVLSDTCVHRGSSLGSGWVKNGRAICPYHGWEYDGDGRCTRVPSLGDSKPPARAKVDSYPVQEKYGIVFAFLGDLPAAERPPLYDVEEFGQEGWKAQTYILEVACYYQRSVENGLDPIHNEFVHPLQGAPMMTPDLQRKPLPVTQIPWGSKFFMPFGDRLNADTALASERSGENVAKAGSWHQGPNQLVTWIQFTKTDDGTITAFHQYFFEQPIDEGHTRIFFLNMRNWLMEDSLDQRVEDVTLQVVGEDIGILENLNPVRTPESNTKEVLMPGDQAVVSYRDCLKDWENRGWHIDMQALRKRQGAAAFAIPCPARRESGNWVLEAVPTLPGADEAQPPVKAVS
jgi:phenylpropionate dioxygenase-like ring-hydroxylating dioxygenase large terminal subunit